MFSFTNLLLQPSKYIRPYLTTSIRTQCFGVDVVAKWIKPLLKTDHSILECHTVEPSSLLLHLGRQQRQATYLDLCGREMEFLTLVSTLPSLGF